MKFEKGKDYKYQDISDFVEKKYWSIDEYGSFNIGQQFLLIIHPELDVTVSFVLTGYSEIYGSVFTCCYSDHE